VACDAADISGASAFGHWATGFRQVARSLPMIFLLDRVSLTAPAAVDISGARGPRRAVEGPFHVCVPHTGKNVERAFSVLGRDLVDRHIDEVGGALQKATPPPRPSGTPLFSRLFGRRRRPESQGEAEQVARAEIARIAAQLRA
jgi:hypothetical protein